LTTIAPALERPLPRAPRPVLFAIGAAWGVCLATEWTGSSGAVHRHSLVEGGPSVWAALLLFLLAWQVMVTAMMLPSSLPLIRLFDAVSRRHEHAGRVRSAFLGGYVAVWTGFGALAFLGDLALYRAVDSLPWLAERPWLIAGGVLAVAGAFQFSDLKEQCLSKCRLPGPYLFAHYRRGAAAGFRLGFGHGVFCLGCCWALMLVMFAAGAAVLWWMVALTALMVYEKLGQHGPTAARVAGVALLAAAGLMFAHPSWLPSALGGPKSFAAEATIGRGGVTRVVRANGYELALGVEQNHATSSGVVSVRLRRGGRAVNGARMRARYTMLDMSMRDVSVPLPQTGSGTYSASRPALGMAGRWGLRLDIEPRSAHAFTVSVVDLVAP
jgi:predicted metal-binding membrane protein